MPGVRLESEKVTLVPVVVCDVASVQLDSPDALYLKYTVALWLSGLVTATVAVAAYLVTEDVAIDVSDATVAVAEVVNEPVTLVP